MQTFDGELVRLVRDGSRTSMNAYLLAPNAGNLRVSLADVPDEDDDALVIVR
jgi:hypothetical protein